MPRSMPRSGVYLFSEAGRHLYVGRSNDLRGDTRATVDRGPLTGRRRSPSCWRGGYGPNRCGLSAGENSRAGLMLDPAFAAAFNAAKERIRAMEYRYVEEENQNKQALLEIYCAVVLETPYNDFGTH